MELTLLQESIPILLAFRKLFSRPTWERLVVVIIGYLLTPGARTIAAALRAMGLSQCEHFQNFHRVLNRARWSALEAACVLFRSLVEAFVPEGAVLIGLDHTLERRRGKKIAAKGIYHDPVRSSRSFFVKSSGLRWMCMMLLAPISWAQRVWALPFLTVLAPSERYHQQQKKRHKTTTDWARQMISLVRRLCPGRKLVFVADSNYACLELLCHCAGLKEPATMVTRLRLDAALYEPAPPRKPGRSGRPRKKGPRLPQLAELVKDPNTPFTNLTVPHWYSEGERVVQILTGTALWYSRALIVPVRWVLIKDPAGRFEPQALVCTDVEADASQILSWYVCRWQIETTFEEARAHLGIETQRQWNPLAIARTTPLLFGLFSLVTLFARHLLDTHFLDLLDRCRPCLLSVRKSAWYPKTQATFSDTLALVRRYLWLQQALWQGRHSSAFPGLGSSFSNSPTKHDITKPASPILERMAELLAYAA